jgi:broad specificity phosphatase PhoE
MPPPPQRPTPEAKRRRRRRRALSVFGFTVSTLGLAWFFESQATTTIMLVRHADTEVALADGGDPPLSERGVARAELLADFLEDIDVIAGVDAIYASEFKRTQQTAAPLAERLGMNVRIADQHDVVDFMEQVKRDHKGRIVLVVSHSDAIAPLIEELHGSKNVPKMAAADYDNLYIVTIPWFGKVKTLRLHYGVGWQPPLTSYTRQGGD